MTNQDDTLITTDSGLDSDESVVQLTEEPQGDSVAAKDTVEFWKSQSRKWERRAKDSAAFEADAQAWRQFQADQIPLQERLQVERDAALAEAELAKAAMLRLEIAQEFEIGRAHV